MECIYQYVNKLNGHMYIGLTNNAKRRFSDHLSAATNPNNKDYEAPIHRAIRKYGIENFDFNIIEDNIEDINLLKQREQYWIEYYDTYNNREHYNATPGGDLVGETCIHKGEEHGKAILTEAQVIYCRKCYKEGKRSREIYNELFPNKEITYEGFIRMWHGKTWKHIMPEVFEHNPHPAKYGAINRDIITERFLASGLSLNAFQKTDECYVGYGTLHKMINNPDFYNGK